MFPQNELAETILLSTYGRKNLFKKNGFPLHKDVCVKV